MNECVWSLKDKTLQLPNCPKVLKLVYDSVRIVLYDN